MSGGIIEHWIEIPLDVAYSKQKAERMTMEYPGCPGGIAIDDVQWPDDEKMRKLINKHLAEILEACREDMKP